MDQAVPGARNWRRMQWAMIACVVLAFMVLDYFSCRAVTDRDAKPFYLAGGVLAMFAQGVWISFDCRHLGRRVGRWPLVAVLCGPFGVWFYLITMYRSRALYLIPISIGVYGAAILLPALVAMLAEGSASAFGP